MVLPAAAGFIRTGLLPAAGSMPWWWYVPYTPGVCRSSGGEWMGGRRKGLVLLWTQLCIFLVMSMALGALCMLRTAITREEACERAAGRIYLAQEVMEKIKYKEKTQRFMAVPEGAVERGGQIFYVTVREKPEEIRGIPLLCVQVSVRDRQGQETLFITHRKRKE